MIEGMLKNNNKRVENYNITAELYKQEDGLKKTR